MLAAGKMLCHHNSWLFLGNKANTRLQSFNRFPQGHLREAQS